MAVVAASRMRCVLPVIAAALVVPAAGSPAHGVAERLAGTVTLAAFDLQQRCGATPGGTATKKTLAVRCSQIGAFDGRPARAGVSYAWTWTLPVGADGRTSANGPEKGKLGLNFGDGNIVYLATTGLQRSVAASTPAKSQAKTTGTWKVTPGGTGRYKGATGSGRYTFSTTLEGSRFFRVAKLTLSGALR
jgi:hypothetical protein